MLRADMCEVPCMQHIRSARELLRLGNLFSCHRLVRVNAPIDGLKGGTSAEVLRRLQRTPTASAGCQASPLG